MTLLETSKTIFLLTIFAYIAPTLLEGIKRNYISLLEPRTHIGIIHIQEFLNNSYHHTEQLHDFFKNSHIKAIILKINCSGGNPGTSQTVFHEIRQLKKEYPKPILALIENSCTDWTYLIASACDYIIAPESSIVGQIGQPAPNNIVATASSEENKTGTLQSIQQDEYKQFTKQVALARKLSLTTVSQWAEGKIFTGSQALGLGLINETGSLCTAIRIIKEKALIEGEIEWVKPKDNYPFNLRDIFPMSSLATNVQYSNALKSTAGLTTIS
jgi:protease IV